MNTDDLGSRRSRTPESRKFDSTVRASIINRWPTLVGRLRGLPGHKIVRDLDDPGHLIVVSCWESREAADEVLERYRDDPRAARANELVLEPRRRTVGVEDDW